MGKQSISRLGWLVWLGLLWLVGCGQPPVVAQLSPSPTTLVASPSPKSSPTLPAATTVVPIVTLSATPDPTPTLSPTVQPTVFVGPFGQGEARCGQLLPVLSRPEPTPIPPTFDPALDLTNVPEAARPAVARILAYPEDVALVAYQIGQAEQGIYLNPAQPMSLASVVKIIYLVAYAQAVYDGRLNPTQAVLLSELEAYYLPNSDLGSHLQAIKTLESEGRIFGEPPAVRLEDVPRLMIEFSSNAATDYLQQRLGQGSLEQTIVNLGLASHTAPCPFVGQFLAMGDRDEDGTAIVNGFRADPAGYSLTVMDLTNRYATDPDFRAAQSWAEREQRPTFASQFLFSKYLNSQASAGDYARLMEQITLNEIGPWEMNVLVRRYLEWPTFFPVNQEKLAWLGYKGGSLPGILTGAYYGQPWVMSRPVVVILFFRNLPQELYQQWRQQYPNDELARWLLLEPTAIPTLKILLNSQP